MISVIVYTNSVDIRLTNSHLANTTVRCCDDYDVRSQYRRLMNLIKDDVELERKPGLKIANYLNK